jgi:hypothetical protein
MRMAQYMDLAAQIESRRTALTVRVRADLLALSTKQVYSLVQRAEIPSIRIASSIRLDPAARAKWIRSMSPYATR